ncbi:MAG TPA: ABC transporter ATP-binding protein [Bryobacteraceae bacterium]|nr:ABC transporter ATP-binding protein [Bryobacteraceae bacterium]
MAAPLQTRPAIEVRDLVKRYQKSKTNAVDGVTFEVRRGEIFGLLGPNGAGKTTCIGVLITSVIPTSGSAAIMGLNVADDPIGIKQHIAVVPQMSNLDRSLKVREILTFHAAYHSVPRKERETKADQLLEELGLGERKNDKVNRFSGGMAQRLMIARALMHSPSVLFLDEPTNNLDPQSRLFLWDRIRALNQQGLTILLTTHDMDEADRLCERVAIMDQGKILVNDTPGELKKMIPGGNALEIRVKLPDTGDTTARERLRESLQTLPGVTKVEQVENNAPTGKPAGPPAGPWAKFAPPAAAPPEEELGVITYRIYAQSASSLAGTAAQAVLSAGAEVRDLHLKQATLEEVFIYLTGRHLR